MSREEVRSYEKVVKADTQAEDVCLIAVALLVKYLRGNVAECSALVPKSFIVRSENGET